MTGVVSSDDPHWKLNEARARLTCLGRAFWFKFLTPDERTRLGGDFLSAMRAGVVASWQRLFGVSETRAVIDAAAALKLLDEADQRWLLHEFGEADDEVEAAIDKAVQTGGLVLVERRRHIFWNRLQVEGDWQRKSTLWDYLWVLVDHARRGMCIDSMTFEKPGDGKYIIHKKSLLTRPGTLPTTLADKIVSAGRGSQKLDLPPDQIHLFEIVSTETICPQMR